MRGVRHCVRNILNVGQFKTCLDEFSIWINACIFSLDTEDDNLLETKRNFFHNLYLKYLLIVNFHHSCNRLFLCSSLVMIRAASNLLLLSYFTRFYVFVFLFQWSISWISSRHFFKKKGNKMERSNKKVLKKNDTNK